MVDVKKEMTFEEVKNFFSATHEYTIEDVSTSDEKLFEITFTEGANKCSTFIQHTTIQQLIRRVRQLSYNMAVKNYD